MLPFPLALAPASVLPCFAGPRISRLDAARQQNGQSFSALLARGRVKSLHQVRGARPSSWAGLGDEEGSGSKAHPTQLITGDGKKLLLSREDGGEAVWPPPR